MDFVFDEILFLVTGPELFQKRRSTVEVRANVSEAPPLTLLLEPQSHMWGQTTQTLSSLSPKRDCGSKGVKELHASPES